MDIITLKTAQAPAAIGPYSQGKMVNGFLFLSGQIPLDAVSGQVTGTTIEEQTRAILKNIEALLTAAGTDFSSVIKTTCFLADMNDFAVFNTLYGEKFKSSPARSCVAVKSLPKGVLAEVEVIACVEES